ncbi:MAG: hypothetical protein QM270_10750 [Bacillota bacterium]|nr:hypothetical protein [Bacillota bacterium]
MKNTMELLKQFPLSDGSVAEGTSQIMDVTQTDAASQKGGEICSRKDVMHRLMNKNNITKEKQMKSTMELLEQMMIRQISNMNEGTAERDEMVATFELLLTRTVRDASGTEDREILKRLARMQDARSGFWFCTKDRQVPSDARVDFMYRPTYYATAILMTAVNLTLHCWRMTRSGQRSSAASTPPCCATSKATDSTAVRAISTR